LLSRKYGFKGEESWECGLGRKIGWVRKGNEIEGIFGKKLVNVFFVLLDIY
jgi:hypothetical protein